VAVLLVIAEVVAPVLHRYDVPPDAVSVDIDPAQPEVTATAAVGLLLTVTVPLTDAVQLLALVTVTL
jgi:hypothetical protein